MHRFLHGMTDGPSPRISAVDRGRSQPMQIIRNRDVGILDPQQGSEASSGVVADSELAEIISAAIIGHPGDAPSPFRPVKMLRSTPEIHPRVRSPISRGAEALRGPH